MQPHGSALCLALACVLATAAGCLTAATRVGDLGPWFGWIAVVVAVTGSANVVSCVIADVRLRQRIQPVLAAYTWREWQCQVESTASSRYVWLLRADNLYHASSARPGRPRHTPR